MQTPIKKFCWTWGSLLCLLLYRLGEFCLYLQLLLPGSRKNSLSRPSRIIYIILSYVRICLAKSNLWLAVIGYPSGQDGAILPARSGLHAISRKLNFPESHIKNPSLAKLIRSRWLDIGLALFSFASLRTSGSTPSRSINAKTKKKNLAIHLDLTLGQ